MRSPILTVHASAAAPAARLAELAPVTGREDLEFVLLFTAPDLLSFPVGEEGLFPGRRVFGCTTAGEITPGGYRSDSALALGFPREEFTAVSRRIGRLRDFGFRDARELVLSASWELRERAPWSEARNTFALLLIDSTSQAEEFVAAALGSELGSVPLVGGSAGDNWQLLRTPVMDQGHWHDDSALLLLVSTRRPFRHETFHHFRASTVRGVVTGATPARRLVHEINGAPAISEYARLCGLAGDSAAFGEFSARPLILRVGDRDYARGFAQVLEDGSMRFACAIDEGMVFRVATPGNFTAQLRERMAALRAAVGEPALVLAFECAARRLEAEGAGLQGEIAALFEANRVWGFSCMGEQANAIHMNNSFNCIAFGAAP